MCGSATLTTVASRLAMPLAAIVAVRATRPAVECNARPSGRAVINATIVSSQRELARTSPLRNTEIGPSSLIAMTVARGSSWLYRRGGGGGGGAGRVAGGLGVGVRP